MGGGGPQTRNTSKGADDSGTVDMKKLLEMHGELKIMVKGISDSQKECQKSQQHFSEEYDGVLKTQKDILSQLKDMSKKVESLTKIIQQKDKDISELKSRVMKLENNSRRRNIEIHGVIEKPIYIYEMLSFNVKKDRSTRSHCNRLLIPKHRTEYYSNSILVKSIRAWNIFNVYDYLSYKTFIKLKKDIKNKLLDRYSC